MNNTRKHIQTWFERMGWKAFPFQIRTWNAMIAGKSGLLNAPTGSGKTYAVFLGALLRMSGTKRKKGLKVLWITPLRALAKDVLLAMKLACEELDSTLSVEMRTGDTSAYMKKKQLKQLPDVLVTTPESIHVMLSQPGSREIFSDVETVIVDEWHELIGSKRGVQTELILAYLKHYNSGVCVWGVSATIGNMDQALAVLHGAAMKNTGKISIIKAPSQKKLHITTLMPDNVTDFPWTGHLGTLLIDKAEQVCRNSTSTLVFTNTRSQAEIWYRQFLEMYPWYAGTIALHHGSLDIEIRTWVEDALKQGKLKVVFCTSSLDLGVDFQTVDRVIQVGSPKGVGRFLQRAGRSGHSPDAISSIAFLPTYALEIVEGAAMKDAVKAHVLEARIPYEKPMDVLVQWLVTLACGDGFIDQDTHDMVRQSYAYRDIDIHEWIWAVAFVTKGGPSLKAYPEYHKVVLDIESDTSKYVVTSTQIARRHRMSIGTIASDASIRIQYLRGKHIGSIEESFITKLKPGDAFWYAGTSLELVHVKEMTAYVRKASGKEGRVPRWMGGRIPLSSQMSEQMRRKIDEASEGIYTSPEMQMLIPIFKRQQELSCLPRKNELLIEQFKSREGYHCFFYPFEGRLAHEGMAAVIALRLSKIKPMSFTMAMNDYGFELLSSTPIPLEEGLRLGLFDTRDLEQDIFGSVNATLMAKRKFREIARIAGLVLVGYPSKQKAARQVQASAELFFEVFSNYEKDNLLLQQAFDETLRIQLEQERLRKALARISMQDIVVRTIDQVTPFSLPILVDRLREKLGSERIEERLRRMSVKSKK